MNEILKKKLEEYKRVFNDDFPTYPFITSMEDGEIVSIIDKCINSGKDVYDSGYLDLEDVNY